MKRVLTLLLIFVSAAIAAQQYYNDAQVWTNISLTKRFGKKFGIHFENQDRWHKNVSELRRVSFDLGASYKFNKHIRLRANYRYMYRRDSEGFFHQRNWYSVALTLKTDVRRFKFYYRNLFQVRMGNTNSDEAQLMRFYDRSKVTIRHETTKRISLWASEEIYVPLNSPSFQGIDRSRTYAGMNIRTWKDQSVDFYFIYQAFLGNNSWFNQDPRVNKLARRDYIYVVSYSIEF